MSRATQPLAMPVVGKQSRQHVSRWAWPSSSKTLWSGGAWGAQSVKRPTSAQVMISRFMGSSPVLGSVLMAQGLEPASVLCLPLSLPSPAHALSPSRSQVNK